MSAEPEELKPFLDALARVPPHPGRLDRDALLFDAGRRSAPRGVFWPLAALGLAVLSAGLTVALAGRSPGVVTVERIVYVPAPAPKIPAESAAEPEPAPAAASPDWVEGLRLRQRVARDGVNALSSPAWAAPPPRADIPTYSELRLNAPVEKGELFR